MDPIISIPPLPGLALGLSMAVLVLGALLVPWVVVRLPVDYFARDPEGVRTDEKGSPLRMIARLLRNALGVVLLLAGIAMLVLPGQGILTMLAAFSLLDLPGKRKLEHKLLGLPAVHAVVAAIPPASRPPAADVVIPTGSVPFPISNLLHDCAVLLAQLVLVDLACFAAGKLGHEIDAARALEVREAAPTERDQRFGELSRRRMTFRRQDDGFDLFAELVVRHADYGHVRDGGMHQQHTVDLGGVDVHAAPDDQLRAAPGEKQIPILVEVTVVAEREAATDARRGGLVLIS